MRFDSYHPAINLIFFTTVIACVFCFNQPVFLLISYLCAFLYSVKLNGLRAVLFNMLLLPFGAVYVWYYSCYNHFGITTLAVNFIGNHITLEAIATGFVQGAQIATAIMWISCLYTIVSADKIIYLLGRIWPRISLFAAIVLRMVPRLKEFTQKVNTSQSCVGRGILQGNFFRRTHNLVRVISIILTWFIESFTDISASMKCRGYTLKGRTAFSIYRFDKRDRSVVLLMFLCITVVLSAAMLDQTRITYNPQIILNRITPFSFLFYAAYAALCLLPFSLQTAGEKKLKRRSLLSQTIRKTRTAGGMFQSRKLRQKIPR